MKSENRYRENRIAKLKRGIAVTSLYAVLIAVAITTLLPFLYMFSVSFRSANEMREFSDLLYLIPKDFSIEGYKKLFAFNPNQFSFFRGVANTMKIEIVFLCCGLWMSTLYGYSFGRIKFRGRNPMLIFCLIQVPQIVTIMPVYTMFSKMGLVGTIWPVLMGNFFGNMGIGFYMERYIKNLPDEIFEAATVDGLGHIGKFFHMAIPLCKPALVIQAVFGFMGVWNELLSPEIYLTNMEDKTLQILMVALNNAVSSGRLTQQPMLMAAAVLSSIPLLILFFSCQHLLIEAGAAVAIKG